MKDNYEQLNSLSMNNDEYDEYEEESLERDEYVDADEDEYAEGEYADEEYADEEYAEGYEDEYADEAYDDGAYPEEYADEGYDDKLSQVLNELAELKRGMNSPSVVSQPAYSHPQVSSVPYIYTNNVPQGNSGNDVVMYNEISRLRDELGRTQNSQSLHVELSKLKEDMEKESKHTESTFLAEIKRLNEKVETLQREEKPKAVSYNMDGNAANVDLEKLISINEAILQNSKAVDTKISSEISAIKQQILHLPNFEELNKAIQSIRKSLKNLDENSNLKDNKLNSDILMAEIHDIKKNINNVSGGGNISAANGKFDEKFEELAQLIQSKTTDNSDILKHIYEIKTAIGSESSQINRRSTLLLSLFNDLAKVKFDLKSTSLSYGEKFNSIDAFAIKLAAVQEANLDTIVYGLEEIVNDFFKADVTKANFDSIMTVANSNRSLSISNALKENTFDFIKQCERAKTCEIGEIIDFLPDIIALKNEIQSNTQAMKNEESFSEIMNMNADILFASDDSKIKTLTKEVRNAIQKLSILKMSEVISYNMPRPQRVFKSTVRTDEKAVIDRLNDINGKIGEISSAVSQNNGDNDLSAEIINLRNDLSNLTDISAIEASVQEIKEQYIDILTRLTDISQQQTLSTFINKEEESEGEFSNNDLSTQMHDIRDEIIQIVRDESSLSQETTELKMQELLSPEEENIQRAKLMDELAYIKDKLDQQEIFVTQIAELRTDVINLATLGIEPHFAKIFDDLVGQIDKLYDDLAAIFNVNDDKYTTLFNEIKTSLDLLAENSNTKEILDSTVNIKSELERINDAILENNNASIDARTRLIDDIAFIRSQIEAEQITEAENAEELQDVQIDNNTVYAELLDLKTHVGDEIIKLQDNFTTISKIADKDETRAANDMILRSLEDIKTYIYDTMLTTASEKETFVDNTKYSEDVQAIIESLEDVKFAVNNIQEELTAEEKTENNEIFAEIDEKIAAVKDTLDILLATQSESVNVEDIKEIKQKNLDLEDVLNSTSARIDDLKSIAADNAERLLSEILDIKEQIHLKELETNLTAYSTNEDDQKTLLKEIADMRERLYNLEGLAKEQSDTSIAQMGLIGDQIEELKASLTNDTDTTNILSALDEIKETLQLTTSNTDSKTTDKMLDDLSFIRNQIESTLAEDNTLSENLDNEDMNIIMEDLTTIKEKLSAFEEYDTVAEILSLREDIKSTRIVDQNDVTTELEALKNDISIIKDDLSQIKNIRDDISGYRDEVITVSRSASHSDIAPTNDEVNMLLSEIVSLRDEVQAYKDDLNGLITTIKEEQQEEDEVVINETDENITIVLDELTNLRTQIQEYKEENNNQQTSAKAAINTDINDLRENILELKDIISRRTSIAEKTAEDAQSGASNELNIVLDEIINLKDEIASVKNDVYVNQEKERTSLLEEINGIKDLLSQPVDLESEQQEKSDIFSAEMDSFKQELYNIVNAITPSISEDLTIVKNQLAELQINQALGVVNGEENSKPNAEFMAEIRDLKALLSESMITVKDTTVSNDKAMFDELKNEILELKSQLAQKDEYSAETVINEIFTLREEMTALKNQLSHSSSNNSEIFATDGDVLSQISLLRNDINDFKSAVTTEKSQPSDTEFNLLSEVMALRDELGDFKASMSTEKSQPSDNEFNVLSEVMALRGEINGFKESISMEKGQPDNDTEFNVLSEVIALHDELDGLKQSLSASTPQTAEFDTTEIMDSIEAIKSDIRIIKDEPDLSVINEVLALRDEFQAFKDEMNVKQKSEIKKPDTENNKQLLDEVQTLRDQLFAISMANINDGTSNDVVYESYNNIILDEITSLREEINGIRNNNAVGSLSEEIAQIKDTVTNLAVDEREAVISQLDAVRREVEALKKLESSDATNNAILQSLDNLKNELENQREADATTLNFMSEMAHLLERQNQYINQSSSSKLSNEFQSLKAEIASSLSSSPAIMEEISKLKNELSQNLGETVQIDNQAILDELMKLKEELSREKPSKENTLVLEEISRIKDELKEVADKENSDSGKEFSKSIQDLKSELHQIADFVNETNETAKPKSTSKTKSPVKSGTKSTTKTQSKKKSEPTKESNHFVNGMSTDELLSKIDATSLEIPRASAVDNVFNGLAINDIETKTDDLDIASKLAKQVANKLIMEQLVQQLGDGGVPRNKVEEIVKEILPQEFSTIQIDEQTDQVRRLANSLVLDKLRARLSNKK